MGLLWVEIDTSRHTGLCRPQAPSFRQRTATDSHCLYTAVIKPDLVRLKLTSDCRILQRKSIDTLLKEAGIAR